MMKKLSFLLVAFAAISATAQSTGAWKSHPRYVGSSSQNLIDAGNMVYFQSSNHLFGFNKETGETGPVDKDNGASDLVATGVYYNYDANYTLITYNNSNIDVIKADGTLVNIPDIKDAVYNGPKAINDVTFAGGKVYMATQFGLVILDDATLQIVDTYYFNKNLTSAIKVGNVMLAVCEDEIFYDIRKNHDDFSQWNYLDMPLPDPHFVALNSNKLFVKCDGELYVTTIEMDTPDTPSFHYATVAAGVATSIQRTPTGFIASFPTLGYYYTFDEQGENPTKVTSDKELYSSHPSGDGTMWALGANGLHQKGSTQYVTPNGWGISANAFYSTYNPGDGNVYVSRTTDNGILNKANSQPTAAKTEIWRYDGDKWENATPVGAPNNTGNYWLVFEPDQPRSYFYSTRGGTYTDPVTGKKSTYYGIISHVVNDTVLVNYDGRNTTTATRNAPLTFMNALSLDNEGNLWGVQAFRAASEGPYVVALPKDKLHKKDITLDDWIIPNIQGMTGSNKASLLAVSRGTDIKVFSTGRYNGPIMFWDNNKDINNTNPRTITYSSLPDTDGATIGWQYVRWITPDTLGNIWGSTTSGVFYLNPAEAWDPNFKVHRVKIKSKISGDGESDYLLEGEDVYCIAVDSLNRKWLGTATQGVFLIDSDNTKILEQFDASNSGLPSNAVYSICPKPNTNSVIFVTDGGIAEYFFEAPSGVETLDNVQAYPNPVLPNFTGLVTISGLINNYLVKITDRDGNTVALLQAQGNTAKWDACDPVTGERLATGVYNVYAGADEASMTQQPITQIRIIK